MHAGRALLLLAMAALPPQAWTSSAAETHVFEHPGGLHTRGQLARAREAEDAVVQSAREQLLSEAEGYLGRRGGAVVNLFVPGYYDDAASHMAAKAALSEDASAAYALALAWQLSKDDGRERFAAKAVGILNDWSTTNRGVSGGDGELVLCYAGIPLIFTADLLAEYEGWSPKERERFRGWARTVFLAAADRKKKAANNHGDWGVFAAVAARHFLDDADGLSADVALLKRRIERNIAPSGELPLENLRNNSGMWYTYFALTPMTGSAEIVRNATGEDLFAYRAANGASLRLALDRFFTYCREPDSWPYRKLTGIRGRIQGILHPSADGLERPSGASWPGNLYEAMAQVYGEPAWEGWVQAYRPIRGGRGWIYPTLLRPEPAAP